MADTDNVAGELESTGDKRTSNTLTSAETYRLCLWLDNNRDRLRHDRLTFEEVAKEAEKILCFTLTDKNVRHAVKSVGFELNPRPVVNSPGGPLAVAYGKIAALEDKNASLEARFSALEDYYKTVHALAVRLSARLKTLENDLGIKSPSDKP